MCRELNRLDPGQCVVSVGKTIALTSVQESKLRRLTRSGIWFTCLNCAAAARSGAIGRQDVYATAQRHQEANHGPGEQYCAQRMQGRQTQDKLCKSGDQYNYGSASNR